MEYKGKLYGKVAGKYIPLERKSEDYDRLEALIKAHIEYQGILIDELNSLVPLAHIHGWRSQNVKRGEEARLKIESLNT